MELKKLDMDDIKRRILYGLIILSLLPLITMFYINLKQDKWETDRNFSVSYTHLTLPTN